MSDFRVRIQAELDAKNLTAQLNTIKNSKIKIPVELDIKNADLQKALSSLTNTNNKIDLNVDTSGIKSGIDATEKLKTSALQLNKFKFKIDTGGLSAELSKIDSQINRFNRESMTKDQRKQIDAIVDSYRDLDKIVDDVSKKNESGALDSEDINKYNTALKTTQNQIKILSNELSGAASATDRIKLTSQMQVWLNENTNATKEARAEIERYIQEINSLGDSMTKGQFNDYGNSFKQINSEMQALGKTGKSWASDFKRAFGQIAQFATAYGVIQNVLMDVPRQMVQSVMDVDSAMTNLQMATGVTDEQAKSLMSTYSELGDQLKATSTDIAASSTEWLKQGKTIEESLDLTEYSTILSKIGDLSIEDATSTITAAMKSYNLGVDEVMSFIDQISAIDMASATDVGGLATAFNEVAANARNAGVEAEKVLAYAATIGETTQEGMSSVGTSLNAIFSRMGNIKLSRLVDPETGEDISNVETSLRRVGIELRESNGEFREFDDVIDEVASNWENYSEVTQRSIASSMAGQHNLNEFLVLMQNYDQALQYMDTAMDSSGSSMEKYGEYTDSLEGRLEGLKNSFQTLSATTLDSNIFSGLIDAGTTFLNILTQIIDVGGGIPTLLGTVGGILASKNGLGKSNCRRCNAPFYKIA